MPASPPAARQDTDAEATTAPVLIPDLSKQGRDDQGDGGGGPPPGRPQPGVEACGLSFDRTGGPVVVVCGLHGGAGTSTLAHALAATAARESDVPILLCESEDAAGDIARLTATSSPCSLAQLAAAYAAGSPPAGGTLARAGDLRVIASGPAPAISAGAGTGDVAAFITAARARHGMTVIDAATLRAPGSRELLRIATHVIWVTVARPGAADWARTLLASDLVPALAAHQVLAVRGARRGRDTSVRRAAGELRRFAGAHCDRLVLVADGDLADISDRRMRATLTALAGALRTVAA